VASLCIFDLDGTLIDSRLDLANSVNATLAEAGKPPLQHPVIFSYVGNGAPVLVRKALGPDVSDEQVAHSLQFFLDYYRDHAMDDTSLYPGVREALNRLHAAGVQLAILTNKPVRISEAIMKALGLAPILFRVYGGNSFDYKKPNPIGIETLRSEAGIAAELTWMVGDSIVDMQTARNAGVKSCGVTYGFQPETLGACPPDLLVDRMEDFAAHVLSL
jgi:phosphoglycolate phosphatase